MPHNMDIPFQSAMNECYHSISALAEEFRRTWCSGWDPLFCMVYSYLKNGLPGRTIFVANCRRPVRLCNSLFVMERQWMQWDNSDCNLCNLLGGRWYIRASVSTSIPRKGRQTEGPSNLESSKGTPSWWNVDIIIIFSLCMPRPSKRDLGQLYMWYEGEAYQDCSADILLLNICWPTQTKQGWPWSNVRLYAQCLHV